MEIVYFSIILILCCIIVFQESKIRILRSTINEIEKVANKSMAEIVKELINKNGK